MIELTWSKLTAFLVLVYAFIEDIGAEGFSALQYSLPFVVLLITGKQAIDWGRKVVEKKNGTQ